MKSLITRFFIRNNTGFYAVIILLAALFCYPAFVPGKTFYAFDYLNRTCPWKSFSTEAMPPPNNTLITDPVNAFYPPLFLSAHKYFKESLNNGIIPLWYKNILGGLPFYAYYTGPVFIAFNGFSPIHTAHDLLLFFHLAVAGIFMFLYMKQIGLCKLAALVASIAWMFNGHIMVWFEFEHIPMLAAVLPMTLFFLEKYFDKKNYLTWLMLVFCFGYTFCVSYAHVIIYQFLFIGAYILFKIFPVIRDKAFLRCRRILLGLITAFCCSLILGLNFFVTHLELVSYGQRKILEFKELFIKTGQLPLTYLGTLLFPNLFGNPTTPLTFTPAMAATQIYNNYNELCIYAGAAVLFMVLISFLRIKKDSHWRFFFLIALYSLLAAMGTWLYYPLAKSIPGLNQTTPTRILYIFSFCMAAMAGMGMQTLISARNTFGVRLRRKRNITIISVALLIIALALVVVANTHFGLDYILNHGLIRYKGESYRRAISAYLSWKSCHIWEPLTYIIECFLLIQIAVWCTGKARRIALILIVLLITVELVLHGWSYNTVSDTTMSFPETPGMGMLKNSSEPARCVSIGKFLPNALAISGIETIEGYASLYPKNYGNYFKFSKEKKVNDTSKSLSRWLISNGYYSPFYELMNTKYLVLSPDISFKKGPKFDQVFKKLYDKEIVIYENIFAFSRAFGVTGFRVVSDDSEALKTMKNMEYQKLRNTVVLHEPPARAVSYKDAAGTIHTKISNYSTNGMLIHSVSSLPGFIVISNNWHPGWKARIDKKATKIFKANGFMQAIEVPPGKHKIELLFRPWGAIIGILISLCAWCVLFIAIATFTIRYLINNYSHKKNNLGV